MRRPSRVLAVCLLIAFSIPASVVAAPRAARKDTVVIAAFAVNSGKLARANPAPSSPGELATDERMWSFVKRIAPRKLLDRLGSLEIFKTAIDRKGSIETDGYAQRDDDDDRFVLGLNVRFAAAAISEADSEARADFIDTIVHEFGHVLSLGPSQMAAKGQGGGLSLEEGTLRRDALLDRFYGRFWRHEFPERGPETVSDEAGSALFKKAPKSFVTPYAATGPVEDFAETFASFVLDPRPHRNSIRSQKVLFFYARPGLVALRKSFRAGIDRRPPPR